MSNSVMVMVATRKGAWLFHSDAPRKTWRADGPHFLGHIINHLMLDPRDGKTLLAAAKTGHLGPIIFRSTDLGRTWKEATRPPAFAPAANGEAARAVDHTFWLTPAHASGEGQHHWAANTNHLKKYQAITYGQCDECGCPAFAGEGTFCTRTTCCHHWKSHKAG